MDLSRDDLKQAMIDAMKESGRDINLSTEDLNKALTALTKQAKDNKSTMGGLFKDMITGRKSYKDLSSTIENLDRRIEELGENTDTASKKQRESLQVQRENMQLVQQHNAAQRAAVDGLTTFTKTQLDIDKGARNEEIRTTSTNCGTYSCWLRAG
jgi:phage-related minor tail protein